MERLLEKCEPRNPRGPVYDHLIKDIEEYATRAFLLKFQRACNFYYARGTIFTALTNTSLPPNNPFIQIPYTQRQHGLKS
jgi:hypothetical protein